MPTRITIVEDDANIAALLAYLLRRAGYAPEIVPDGRAALELVRTGAPPAAVVLDRMLPYEDGFAVASAMRAHARWADVPILLLSASEPDPDRHLPVDAWMSKPFDPAVLVANVRRMVRAEAA